MLARHTTDEPDRSHISKLTPSDATGTVILGGACTTAPIEEALKVSRVALHLTWRGRIAISARFS
jgi:hypothetical protein